MKLLHILTAASLASAIPTLEKRGPLVDAITTALGTAKTVTGTNFGAIHDALGGVKGTAGALAPQVEKLIQTTLNSTLDTLRTTQKTILGSIADVTATVKTTPAALTYAELEQVKLAFLQTQDLASSLKAGIASTTMELGLAIDGAISAEMEAIRKFANQFMQPIQGLADAVKLAGSRGNLQALAFGPVLGELLLIIKTAVGTV